MKTLFIPVKSKSFSLPNLNNLPKNIALAYSIQYEELAKHIKEKLSRNHSITLFKQVLGCSTLDFAKQTQAILLIGSGRFHALSLSLTSKTSIPIYIIEESRLTKLSEREIESFKQSKKAAYLKFLNANEAGIIVSLKPGQENLKKAIALKSKLKKKSYIFIGDNINPKEFENFSINSWINTACPRLDFDSSVINIEDLKDV